MKSKEFLDLLSAKRFARQQRKKGFLVKIHYNRENTPVEWWDENEKPLFYTKKGELTMYAFACGYVQERTGSKRWKKMFMEHNHFHVMEGKLNHGYHTWETFDKLYEAKDYYQKIKVD